MRTRPERVAADLKGREGFGERARTTLAEHVAINRMTLREKRKLPDDLDRATAEQKNLIDFKNYSTEGRGSLHVHSHFPQSFKGGNPQI